MNASTDPVANALFGLNTVGSPNEPIDVVLRAIILEIAKANMNGHPVREKDIVRNFDVSSHVAVHRRLEMLVGLNLVVNTRNPADRRERLLYLTPLALEKFERLAQEIRRLRDK
jgi:DNA-binding MarR family transcriptional regulator